MTIRRITLSLAALIGLNATAAHGQSMTRDEVARALLDAEALRQSIRVEFEPKFREGARPKEAFRTSIERLTDGMGRYRQVTHRPPSSGNPQRLVQVDVWDGKLSQQEFYIEGEGEASRHHVLITDQAVPFDNVDEIGPSMGIRCPRTEQTVGQVLSDHGFAASVRDVVVDGNSLVEVTIPGASFAPPAIFVFRYDPQRQWLLVERETYVHSIKDGNAVEDGAVLMHARIVNTDFIQVGDVWMPGRVDNYSTFFPGTERLRNEHLITYVKSVELNPAWTNADFTIDLAALPLHSQIADARWGGTYRLGEDVVLMQGRLHQLPQPILEPIDPSHYADAIIGATPIVDPDVIASGSTSSRSLSDWLRLTGYLLIAAGAVGALVLFFRHRFSGS